MESRFHSLLLLLPLLYFLTLNPVCGSGAAAAAVGVIKVNYKFAGSDASLSALRAHDDVRHLAILAGVDLPLGGTGRPDASGCASHSSFVFWFCDFHSTFSLLSRGGDVFVARAQIWWWISVEWLFWMFYMFIFCVCYVWFRIVVGMGKFGSFILGSWIDAWFWCNFWNCDFQIMLNLGI